MAEPQKAEVGANVWQAGGVFEQFNQIDDWIGIESDGTVNVFSGKVELGTGVRTALAQIAAEELDVPFDRVHMVMGDTRLTPNEGYTAGSKTINLGGFALRRASAEARQALLELASDQLDAVVEELDVRDGVVVVRHHPARTITYGELMGGKRFGRPISGKAPLKRPEDYSIVGQPIPRVDLPLKFTGAPSFVQDLRLPNMLHGRIVRPPSPGAQLISLDANSITGVQIVRLGNFVGVVAESEQDAVRAAKEIKIEWRETAHLPPMNELYDELKRLPATDEVVEEEGDVQSALQRASTRLNATYYQPYHAHASVGPACAVASFSGDQVTVWCSTQGVYPLRGALADLLEMPLDKVQVVHVEGAGCYGHNGSDDVAADAAILARAAGKPVRVQWSRQDEFAWEPYAPAMVMEVKGGLDAQGHVIAWDYECWSPPHGSRARSAAGTIAGQLITGQPAPARPGFGGGDRNAPTNYVLSNQRVTMHWIARSPLRTSSFRSLGATANTFANESFVDELAAAAHRDPVEFHLSLLDDPRAHEVIRAAAGHAGWGAPLESDEGRGFAYAQYENDEAYIATIAHVKVDVVSGEVRVKRLTVAHDCGLIINPDGLRNQIEGNVIQSVSRALKEQVTFDDTRVTSVDWDTYPILKFQEVPDVEVVLINRPHERAVGAGEPASITTAAAIANAVYAAAGARLRQVPFTPKRVREAIAQASK